jgi:hypothetical protein
MMHYDKDKVPETAEDWVLPTFLMSTYDGDVVSWRYMLPHAYVTGDQSSLAAGEQYYVYQTMPRLPTLFNMTYDGISGLIEVEIYGSAGMCGRGFEAAKSEQEYGIVFEDPLNDGNGTAGNITRL